MDSGNALCPSCRSKYRKQLRERKAAGERVKRGRKRTKPRRRKPKAKEPEPPADDGDPQDEPMEFVSIEELAKQIVFGPASPYPGPLELNPYQRGILNAVEDADIRIVVVMGSSRIGKSMLAGLAIMQAVAVKPQSMVYFGAIDRDVARFRQRDFQRLLDAAPRIAARLPKTGQVGNNFDSAMFNNGGTCYWRGGTTPNAYRGYEASFQLLDEIDVWQPRDMSDPVGVAMGRGANFPDERQKTFIMSSPAIHGPSRVDGIYGTGSMNLWTVEMSRVQVRLGVRLGGCGR